MLYNLIRFYLFTLFFVCTSSGIQSQTPMHCVDDVEALTNQLKANLANIKAGKAYPREEMYVPIKFHLVADDEGQGRIDLHEVFEELCLVNEEFKDAGMTFYIQDGFNLIDDNSIYESPANGIGVARMVAAKRDKGSTALNIFITQNAQRGDVENGTTLGYYSRANDWVVVRKNQIGRGNNTLVHEIGHYFSLAHPFRGWDDEPWFLEDHGNPVLITRVNGVQIELVDGSNCETSADLICDTPADYNFGFSWDTDCPEFDLTILDRNRDTLRPQQNNHMSYFLGCVPYTFTDQQNMVMVADYNSSFKNSIRTGYVPNDQEVNTDINVIAPGNNTLTEFYNGVELRWNKVENATDYAISISSGAEQLDIFTQDTAIYVTELSPDRTYSWYVVPYNESSTCAARKSSILRTNDLMTYTNDPEIFDEILLSPNPAKQGVESILKITSSQSLSAKINISDLSGKRISTWEQKLILGENRIILSLDNYNEGLYILSLHTLAGTLTRKILIN